MASNEHKEGFEIFLKEKTDSYKMYPSEKVWSNLNDHLHPRKKWPYLAMAVIFLGLGFGGKIYDTRYNTQQDGLITRAQIHGDETAADSKISSKKDVRKTAAENSILAEQHINKIVADNTILADNSSSGKLALIRKMNARGSTRKPLTLRQQIQASSNNGSIENDAIILDPAGSGMQKQDNTRNILSETDKTSSQQIVDITQDGRRSSSTLRIVNNSTGDVPSSFPSEGKLPRTYQSNGSVNRLTLSSPASEVPALKPHSLNAPSETTFNSESKFEANQNTGSENKTAAIRVKKPGKNRLGWQIYLSPSISYRNLYGTINKNSYSAQILYASLPGRPQNVNDAVFQSPSIGTELGTAMVYNIGKHLRIKGGLQFNYSQYIISAYSYSAEIAPLSAAGIGHTEINAISFHRNFDGYSKTQLTNEHFSISIPVGAELIVFGNKDFAFNIGATLQPGFMLNNQSYMLSTNLKNYAKVPSLYRTFNVNTAIEAFLSFNMGSVRWNVGPQLRYQLMSSYKESYPIKEHLYDYGLKIGVTKTIR